MQLGSRLHQRCSWRCLQSWSYSRAPRVCSCVYAFHRRPLSTNTIHIIPDKNPYWHQIPQWRNTSVEEFLSYGWQVINPAAQDRPLLTSKVANTIQTPTQLLNFMRSVLPAQVQTPESNIQASCVNRDRFIEDVEHGIKRAPMSIRLTPHILSSIDWQRPLSDPLLRQFVPLASRFYPDHPALTLDSLNEVSDSPLPGLIHRYPDKVAFMCTFAPPPRRGIPAYIKRKQRAPCVPATAGFARIPTQSGRIPPALPRCVSFQLPRNGSPCSATLSAPKPSRTF